MNTSMSTMNKCCQLLSHLVVCATTLCRTSHSWVSTYAMKCWLQLRWSDLQNLLANIRSATISYRSVATAKPVITLCSQDEALGWSIHSELTYTQQPYCLSQQPFCYWYHLVLPQHGCLLNLHRSSPDEDSRGMCFTNNHDNSCSNYRMAQAIVILTARQAGNC